MTEAEILAHGYVAARQLPDGRWIALMSMLYTTGLFVNIDPVGYSYRYCYEHAGEAFADFIIWDGSNDPPGPWVKRKGLGHDLLNPRVFNPQAIV